METSPLESPVTPLESPSTPLEEGARTNIRDEQFSRVGRGRGLSGTGHSSHGLPSGAKLSTRGCQTTWFGSIDVWPDELRRDMQGVNALHLELALPQLPLKELELGRKSPQRTKQWYLARLAELRQWSQDSKRDSQDVKSDSGSSVASSVAARRFWESVCQCGSSENEPPE